MIRLDGKKLVEEISIEMKKEVRDWLQKGNRPPHLAAVLVGDNSASQVYVRNKMKLCDTIGFRSSLIQKSATISESDLLEIIYQLNKDPEIDGFIVQLPLPDHIDAERINLAIDPKKDVDGFHPVNVGRMTLGMPAYLPATPQGILTILERYGISVEGKHCVVLGRSHIVGRPISILLSSKLKQGNATVTLVHSRTRHVEKFLQEADIIVAAIGKPEFVKADHVKKGAIIIDVGINRVADKERKKGYRLVGDVAYKEVAPICSYITPVPGGVGRMTVLSLMQNTFKAAKKEVYG